MRFILFHNEAYLLWKYDGNSHTQVSVFFRSKSISLSKYTYLSVSISVYLSLYLCLYISVSISLSLYLCLFLCISVSISLYIVSTHFPITSRLIYSQWRNVVCWRPSAPTAPPFLAPLPHSKSKAKLSYFRKYATKIYKNVCFQSNMRNFTSTLVKFSKLSHIQTTIWRPPRWRPPPPPPPPHTAGSAGAFVTPLYIVL